MNTVASCLLLVDSCQSFHNLQFISFRIAEGNNFSAADGIVDRLKKKLYSQRFQFLIRLLEIGDSQGQVAQARLVTGEGVGIGAAIPDGHQFDHRPARRGRVVAQEYAGRRFAVRGDLPHPQVPAIPIHLPIHIAATDGGMIDGNE